jgi:hypothetical protein
MKPYVSVCLFSSPKVFGIVFSPFQKREIATYGVRHVRFWQLEGNPHRMTMSSKATHYSGKAKPQVLLFFILTCGNNSRIVFLRTQTCIPLTERHALLLPHADYIRRLLFKKQNDGNWKHHWISSILERTNPAYLYAQHA